MNLKELLWYVVGVTVLGIGLGVMLLLTLFTCPPIFFILLLNWWVGTSQD